MSALFNFHSFLTVILLGICACTYFKMQFPAVLEQRTGFRGFFWKAARIGNTLLFDLLLGTIKPVGIRRLLYDGCFNNLLLSYIIPLISGRFSLLNIQISVVTKLIFLLNV
ncbi:hypothetical protein AHAS_Ahas03G0183100 [Arachis hypogaea]